MQLSFDHLVWFLQKPESAIPALDLIGIHTVNGGRHESWGTYNTLTYFGLSYIEYLGINNLSVANQKDHNVLITQIVKQLSEANGEGPARIAIRTDRIEKLADKLSEAGFTVHGPIPGKRVRTDGEVINWSLLFLENTGNELALPFFIQWEKSDEDRLADLEAQKWVDNHPLGNLKLESVGFAVKNFEDTVAIWYKLLNQESSKEVISKELNARCRKFDLNGVKLEFYSPLGEGLIQKVLSEKGETPFQLTVSGTNSQRSLVKLLNGYWSFY
jgi:hypothetical protein